MRQTIAAVIPTFNVADLLDGALRSVAWCDQIIVVDMFSTDHTADVCQRFPNCRLFRRRGYIYENFNFGMEQADTDWILRIDSDERVSPALRDEILALLSRPADATPHAAYTAPMVVYLFGRQLKWGPVGEQRIRNMIVRRGRARYRVRMEHEDFAIDGTVGSLRHPYYHYATRTIGQFVAKINYYSDRDLERLERPVTRSPFQVLSRAARHFFYVYVRRRGYRDGYHGFAFAALRAVYLVVGDLKEWEKAGDWPARHDAFLRSHFDDPTRGGEAPAQST